MRYTILSHIQKFLQEKFLSMLMTFCFLVSFSHLTVFAEIDMERNCIKDFDLRLNSWCVGPCKNGKASCIKNLIRYDGTEEFDAFLRNLEKTAEAEKEEAFWIPLLEKILIGVGSTGVLGAFTYLAPATTILATVGTLIIGKIIYIAHDNIIEPIGEITGTFTKGFI